MVETNIEDSGHEYTEPNLLRLLKSVRPSQCTAQRRRQQPNGHSDGPYASTCDLKELYVSVLAGLSSNGRAPFLLGKSYTAFMAGSSMAKVISSSTNRACHRCAESCSPRKSRSRR